MIGRRYFYLQNSKKVFPVRQFSSFSIFICCVRVNPANLKVGGEVFQTNEIKGGGEALRSLCLCGDNNFRSGGIIL
jgi:hypothetical protein